MDGKQSFSLFSLVIF